MEDGEGSAVKAGKIASLSLALAMTALSAVVWRGLPAIPWLEGVSPVLRLALLYGILGILFIALLMPFGIWIDRSIAELRRYIESAASSDSPVTFSGPPWLRPITRALAGAVDYFHQRERALRNQIGDLEIRHRVSEAERRQIEAVLHSLRDPVVVTDAFNEIVMANEAAASVLGFDLAEGLHHPIERVIRDRRLCQLISDTRETANFAERRHLEHELYAGLPESPPPETEKTVYDVTLTCVESHKHEVAGVVAILRDITREREISQLKSEFVSKASHELRTPVSSIRAGVEMLIDGEVSDEKSREEFYRTIQDETNRLGRLIDNMLNISRIEAGIVQIDRDEVDIKGLIGRAITALEPQAKDKEISLHAKLANVDLCVEGDADMLYQVVLNLLSNAIKYTPKGARVTVAADSDNLTRSVHVSVSDTGLGIPPDALPRLFEKFYRVENYKRVARGTGLGLSLCQHIVETLHHGQIGVESKLGMGSKFWFSIPMTYAGSEAAA
jgi:two-component system phosphate regulon sensor histidine kinase PhoR